MCGWDRERIVSKKWIGLPDRTLISTVDRVRVRRSRRRAEDGSLFRATVRLHSAIHILVIIIVLLF